MRPDHHKFYGSTTVGEKGQVVIPVSAREELNLVKGQKLLAFGLAKDMIILAKPEMVAEMTARLTERAAKLGQALSEESAA